MRYLPIQLRKFRLRREGKYSQVFGDALEIQTKYLNNFRSTYKNMASQVKELLPVFDATGFMKIPKPTSKIVKPSPINEKEVSKFNRNKEFI